MLMELEVYRCKDCRFQAPPGIRSTECRECGDYHNFRRNLMTGSGKEFDDMKARKDAITARNHANIRAEVVRIGHLVTELRNARDERSAINLKIRQLEHHLESLGFDCDGNPFRQKG